MRRPSLFESDSWIIKGCKIVKLSEGKFPELMTIYEVVHASGSEHRGPEPFSVISHKHELGFCIGELRNFGRFVRTQLC